MPEFLTLDPQTLETLAFARRVATTQASVLIQGESGTGKELVAHLIHRTSARAARPLVSLNCGAIQPSLLLSELFGHEKGAFTGATSRKTGLVELAHGGTLFLDEIGEMHPEAQAKLLRFLQQGECYRVGGTQPLNVDTRVLCATNRNLEALTSSRRFRQDLLYRINTIVLTLSPLRKRPCDIGLLAQHFLTHGGGGCARRFSQHALRLLQSHGWPGNVRELQNTVERFKILVDHETVTATDVRNHTQLGAELEAADPLGNPFELAEVEKQHILRVLAHFKGNKTRAAGAMGITVKTLYNKLARYEAETPA